MSLNLDTRQRAMLQEMGHPLWWPQTDAPVADAPAANEAAARVPPAQAPAHPAPPTPVAPAVAINIDNNIGATPAATGQNTLNPDPIPAPVAPQAPAAAPTPAASQPAAVSALPADFPRVQFSLGEPVLLALNKADDAAAPTGPVWMVVAELPGGAPPAGDAGQLVLNMLRAMRLANASVYWVPLQRIPYDQAADAAPAHTSLAATVQQLQPRMALVLGLPAARHLLPGNTPLDQLRGQVHTLADTTLPAVVTYDPAYLLRTPQAKARAWADLCLALAHTAP